MPASPQHSRGSWGSEKASLHVQANRNKSHASPSSWKITEPLNNYWDHIVPEQTVHDTRPRETSVDPLAVGIRKAQGTTQSERKLRGLRASCATPPTPPVNLPRAVHPTVVNTKPGRRRPAAKILLQNTFVAQTSAAPKQSSAPRDAFFCCGFGQAQKPCEA